MEEKIEQERLAIHEACHAVVARLFEDNLHLDYMTINEGKLGDIRESGATIYATIGVKPKQSIGPSIAVVSLAGIVGEMIWRDGTDNVFAKKSAILANPNIIDGQLGGGDFELFQRDSSVNSWKYGGDEEYEQLVLNFLIDFLCYKQVWPVVERLAQEVLKKNNLTLDEQELNIIFETSGYTEFLKKNKEALLRPFEQTINLNSGESQLKKMMTAGNCDIFSSGDQAQS